MTEIDQPNTATKHTLRSVLRDGPVRTYATAQAAVTVGIFLQAAILGKQVYDISGSELALGLLGLAQFLPAAALVLVTGSVADRYNRRTVATIALSGEVLCAIALLLYARTDPTAVGPLYIITVAFGAARAFMAPATRAMPPMIAPDGALPRVIALNSSIFTLAFIIGPASSGFLYEISPWVGYAVGAVLQFVGLLGLARVKFRRTPTPPGPDDRPSLHSAAEGLRFIRRTPLLFAAISLDLFAVLFGGAVALLPAIAEDQLHVGDIAYGWLRAAVGIGAALTAMVLAVKPIERHVGATLLAAVGCFGAFTIVLGITHTYAVAFVAIAVLSGADMVSVYIRSTLVPLITPDDKRGRVMAVESVFIGASNELGAFESGVTASAIGTAPAVIAGGVATLAVVGVFTVRNKNLRRIDRFSDLDPEGVEPTTERSLDADHTVALPQT